MSHDKNKGKKHDPIPPSVPPPSNPTYDITRVHAAGGDGLAIVTVNPDPSWSTGFVVIITALQRTGLIQLNHPYKVVRVNSFNQNTGEYNLQEEDEEGEACIPWNNNADGDGPNPGTVVLR